MLLSRTHSMIIRLLLILIFLTKQELFAQSQNLATRLVSMIELQDTARVVELLTSRFQNSWPLLVQYTGLDSVILRVELSGFDQPSKIYSQNLPYFETFFDVNNESQIRFTVIRKTQERRTQEIPYRSYRLANCPAGSLAYVVLDTTPDLTFRCIPIPPCPADTIIQEVKIPESRFLNYRVLSSGAISVGSFIWFWYERTKAINEFEKYEKATTKTDVVSYKVRTEKHRVRRNIAGAISAASGVTFGYFFIKNLVCPPRKEVIRTYQTHSNLKDRLQFGLQPHLGYDTVQLSLNVKL